MSKKYTIEEIQEYIEDNATGYILLSNNYENQNTKLLLKCPNNHKCSISWGNFKNSNVRCNKCFKNKMSKKYRYKFDDVVNYFNNYGYKVLSKEYLNNKSKLELKCPNGHICNINYNNFKCGTRCRTCKYINQSEIISGKNNPMWKTDRESINIIKRLRKNFSRTWIIKHMKDDPNYDNFLNNSNNYHLDHIIPVKAFSEYVISENLNEIKIKKIANNKRNLQLLTEEENYKKSISYNKNDIENYIDTYYKKELIKC